MRQQRVVVVFVAMLLVYALVSLQLVRLQVVEHDMWARESARSTMRYESLPFERGWILDRHGEPLARTEEVSDLVFVYRDWRRSSAAGALAAAERTRHGALLGVSAAIEHGPALVERLAELRLAELAALEPRDRRGDLLFYVGALLGDGCEEAARAGLRAGGRELERRLGELPGAEAARERLLDRLARETAALPDLARVLRMELDELLAGMEAARQQAEDDVLLQVVDALEARRAAPVDAAADADALLAFLDSRDGYSVAAAARRQFDGRPRRLAAAVPYDTQTLVNLRARDFPGFALNLQQRRVYPAYRGREVAPLVIGAVGPPSEHMRLGDSDLDPLQIAAANQRRLVDLAALADPTEAELQELEELRLAFREIDYRMDEEAGTRGLERVLEPVLRGKRGWIASQRDERGRSVEHKPPQRGLNVTLTLDVALQAAAEDVLDAVYAEPPIPGERERWTGALVVLDPRTGEVLVLASGPRATREEFRSSYRELLEHRDAPLRHRALRAGASRNLPPPGSVFKPVTALAWRGFARATGLPDLSPEHWCGQTLSLGTRSMSCLGSHGSIGLQEALARSCNIYFYELGREMGTEPLYALARRFGFGQRSRLVVGNERLAAAAVPLDEHAGLDGLQEEVNPLPEGLSGTFDAMRFAIGQHPLDDVTPLQVAVMMGALGTGELRGPSLVRDVEGFPELPPAAPRGLGLDPLDLRDIRAGLLAVVESPHGTAHDLAALLDEPPYGALRGRLAAKTGTAEVGTNSRDHAWLAGYFPAEAPRAAFAVLVEDVGLHGGEGAVPVFERFLRQPAVRAWLERDVLDGALR